MVKKTTNSKTFGSYIRELRTNKEIGQRELAKKIGVAPSYLNDMEKNKRAAPKNSIIKKLSTILKADLNLMYDLAGNSKKSIAADVEEFIKENPSIISLIRSIKENNVSSEEINNLEKKMSKSETKSLIVAAGLGSRLKKHTENLPKCMLDFNGKTFSDFKKNLSELLVEKIQPISKKIKQYRSEDKELINVLNTGSEKANHTAEKTILDIKKIVGLL